MNNILVYGSNKAERDACLIAVLQRIKQAVLTLSKEKCEFNRSEIKFLGQLVDQSGVHPDPDKVPNSALFLKSQYEYIYVCHTHCYN